MQYNVLEALVDSVLSVRLREGETNVVRRKVTSVVARPCYITRVPYRFYCFYWVGGGLSAVRWCARVYSGLQRLLLCLSIWRSVCLVVVVFGLLERDLRLYIRNDHFRMCTLWSSG